MSASYAPVVWIGLIGTPILVSLGQVLFKMVGVRTSGGLLAIVQEPLFYLSLVVYAIATFAWIFVLRSVPLGLAYTFTALGFIIVPIISSFLFGEAMTIRYALGTALVIAGLLTIHT